VPAIRYLVEDVEASVRFYCGFLNFELKESFGPSFAVIERGELELWLSGPGSSARKTLADGVTPKPGGFNRFVIPVVHIHDYCERMRIVGALRNPPVKGPGGIQALVVDPSGNLIELFEMIKDEQP